jgi:hypothetical protein
MELSGGGDHAARFASKGDRIDAEERSRLADIVARHERELVPEWLSYQLEARHTPAGPPERR